MKLRQGSGPFRIGAPALIGATFVLAACVASTDDTGAWPRLGTLDGAAPLVIGHRGLPGLYPEETRPAYESAADAGADWLEEDLHLTKDCVLVARHNPWLSDNTNIAAVARNNPAVAARKRIVPGRQVDGAYPLQTRGGLAHPVTDLVDPADATSVLKALVVDGEDHVGDWAVSDFTVAELKAWIGGTTYDAAKERPSALNGKPPVLTMQEIIDIANARGAATGRVIGVYPEAKNPIWNNGQARANGCGCGSGSHPFEDAIVRLIKANGLNDKAAPLIVQSFDPASLRYMRSIGLATRVVQLVGGHRVDYSTGAVVYRSGDAPDFVGARPYSWTLAGDGRDFGAMLTPAGLAEIKTYADGIGPWKLQVMKLTGPTKALADVNGASPTGLVADAHRAGLFVHVYTFRDEQRYLAGIYKGDPAAELRAFFRAGVDGVFTDFTPSAVAARTAHLRESGTPLTGR